ncbi:Asp-tRNA(Asn)/Glu-tRNA(Gln) amidotransferase subunit GatA [candidate division WS5 bacterium]|uniref:Glutamyl-tRNA(Gln) amidotransferase subunit A n=1 Tax=candidate division WS5 bacterium TaxID=2093353 RepID=A0A419DAJ7_9BACT|nr:MAG: Asp-tRNA(Asn)/Glu-tRNA(Gln) amidotransferase subunit GatA [candidate division WS5 bacterium]
MKTTEMTIKELAKEDKVEVLSVYLDRIKEVEPKLHAFLTTITAEDIDSGQARMTGNSAKARPLQGIPVGIKDVLCTRNMRTTASAKMLDNFIPPYDATIVKKLRAAGAIIVGKNNCDAWAHGASTENSDYEVTPNPWDLTRVSGGSSGGSAAAVAAGEVPYSIGTDTGGSIRQPASFCGVVGLKPTYGRVSRYGLIAMASSLDCPGPITRTVEDATIVMNVIAGEDEKDPTTLKKDSGLDSGQARTGLARMTDIDYAKDLDKDLKGVKIGVPKEYFGLGLDKEVEQVFKEAIKTYESLGAEIVDISLPHTEYGVATYYIIQTAEVSSNLGRYDGVKYGFSAKDSKDLIDSYFKTRDEGFGDEAKRRIMLGTYVLSSGYYDAYYLKAAKVRRLIHDDFVKAFEKVDIILTPTAPTPAFKIGEKADPVSMYMADVFTAPVSLAGLPAMSVPAGFSTDKLPVGIQIIGPHFEESRILNVGHQFEKATLSEDWRKYKVVV